MGSLTVLLSALAIGTSLYTNASRVLFATLVEILLKRCLRHNTGIIAAEQCMCISIHLHSVNSRKSQQFKKVIQSGHNGVLSLFKRQKDLSKFSGEINNLYDGAI